MSGNFTMTELCEHVQKLGTILTLLNPPYQEYKKLANELSCFLEQERHLPPTVHVLAAYFELIGHGYAEWQTCYDYHSIHEYFYGAYSNARTMNEEETLEELIRALYYMTLSMIGYTWCEKSILCNDPKALTDHAEYATHYSSRALKILGDLRAKQILPQILYEPIAFYLNIHQKLFRGLHLCGANFLSLFFSIKKIISTRIDENIQGYLNDLKSESPELFTELRTQYRALQQIEHIAQQYTSHLRVKNADIHLRALGHVHENLVEKLFDHCDCAESRGIIPKELTQKVRSQTGLDIALMYEDHLPDLFETSFGEEYLRVIVFEFDLKSGSSQIIFHINDGAETLEIQVEALSVRVSRMGTIALEFTFHVHNASVAATRVLKSLLAPGTGQFDFIWQGHSPITDETEQNLGAFDFVDHYLYCEEWVDKMREILPKSAYAEASIILTKWDNLLTQLTSRLPRVFRMPHREDLHHYDDLKGLYEQLNDCFEEMCHWGYNSINYLKQLPEREGIIYPDPMRDGDRLFLEGVRFAQLKDIARDIFHRLGHFIQSLSSKPVEIGTPINYDPDAQWQSILLCREFAVVEADDVEQELAVHFDIQQLIDHPEFKGLILPPMTVRAVHDWMFTQAPESQNISTSPNYLDDVTFLDQNNVFLYWPGEPHYITEQIVRMAGVVGESRVLITSLNQEAEHQISQLETFFSEIKDNEDIQERRKKIIIQRTNIHRFQAHARYLLDKLLSTTMTKYQDTSDLIQAMMHASSLNAPHQSLERKFSILDQLEQHLTELIEREVDNQTKANQDSINKALFILTFLQAISVLPVLFDFFTGFEQENLHRYIGAVIVFLILIGVLVFLFYSSRANKK
jgi:hypothetical protein